MVCSSSRLLSLLTETITYSASSNTVPASHAGSRYLPRLVYKQHPLMRVYSLHNLALDPFTVELRYELVFDSQSSKYSPIRM